MIRTISRPAGGAYPAAAADRFNKGFDWLADRYGRITARAVRAVMLVLIVYAGLLALAAWRFAATPAGFIPAQDQGYFITVVQMPPGSSLERTDAVVQTAIKTALATKGIRLAVAFAGLDGSSFSNAPNAGTLFIQMDSFADRKKHGQAAADILGDLRQRMGTIPGANILVIPPPPVRGIGTGGGFKMMVQDRSGKGYPALEAATFGMMMAGNQTAGADQRLHPVQHRHAAGVRRYRSPEGATARRQSGRCVLDAADLSRLELCQRFQPVRPHLPRYRPGRCAVPQRSDGYHQSEGALGFRGNGAARLGGDAARIPAGRIASCATICSRRPNCRAIGCPASHRARRWAAWKGWRPSCCPKASAMNGPSLPIRRRRRAIRRRPCSSSPWCSSSCCWRRNMNRWCCRWRSS